MIDAKIITDSLNPVGIRLTTFLLKYPRYIHSEMMTHRVFSRNTSSSRAIPVSKLIEEAENEYVEPTFWGKTQKGMQSFNQLELDKIEQAKLIWNNARLAAIEQAKLLSAVGLHKQYTNRILEPFTHITAIFTGTEFGNFFNLRAHEDAMPEIQELADKMLIEYMNKEPKSLKAGEWHLPLVDKYIGEKLRVEDLLKISTARCARTSYLNYDGKINFDGDVKLHDDLIIGGHWSPFEHPAQALDNSDRCGNLTGYKQYRKFFSNENRITFNAKERLERKRS